MKTFILKILLLLIPFILMVGINYSIDGANLFHNAVVTESVESILSGQNVGNLTNYDERIFQKELIKNQESIPAAIAIGSSRIMQLGAKEWGGELYNHAVSSASIMDLIAIVEHYNNRGELPKTIIIGIDPKMLLRSAEQIRWVSVRNDYYSFCLKNDIVPIQADHLTFWKSKLHELISPNYLLENLLEDNNIYKTPFDTSALRLELLDGSLLYKRGRRNMPEEAIKEKIQLELSQLKESNLSLDPILVSQFEKLVSFLIEREVEVIFFKSPYYAGFWEFVMQDSDYLLALKHIDRIANENELKTMGYYSDADLRYGDFFDIRHPRRELIKKIVQESKPL